MAKIDNTPYRISGEELSNQKSEYLQCTVSLDVGLSGGIRRGSVAIISGMPGLGKTTVALQYGADAQHQYNSKIFYFNIEGRLGKETLAQIYNLKTGIDHFEIVMPTAIRDVDGNVVGHKKWSAEIWWDLIGETIVENPGSVLIIDSVANMSSSNEIAESTGYQDRGMKNKLEAQFCRKYLDLTIPSRVTVFLLTHIMANTSGYGKSLLAKIGNHLKHQSNVHLFGKRIEKWQEHKGKILGHDMHFIIEKNSLGNPYAIIQVPLRYGEGIDVVKDTILHAINWDIIKKKGSWFVLPFQEVDDKIEHNEITDENEKDLIKIQGEIGLRNWLILNKKEYDLIDAQVKEMLFGI